MQQVTAIHLPPENGRVGDIISAGDCEKGLGRLLTTWAFVYPV